MAEKEHADQVVPRKESPDAGPHKEPKGGGPEISTVPSIGVASFQDKVPLGDLDPAMAVAGGEIQHFSPEEERSVLRKIDMYILPLMCWIYAIQFADKISLNYASLMGIREDTHLDPRSQQYSWASSIFYAGYILYE